MSVSRRRFLGAGAVAAAGLSLGRFRTAGATPLFAPLRSARLPAHPVIVSSANGLRGVAKAYDLVVGGSDPLDAVIAGVNIQELDPEDQSVGLGGLPNEEGVVQLDASCMHGPTKRAGAVGALEDIATPSLVAKAVMDYTDHIFLAGAGAKKFALEMGFKEQNLLTEKSRQDWLRWKAHLGPDNSWLKHDDDVKVKFTTGTINMNVVTTSGDLASVTTTSGLSWKLPGRVGDSAIVGAGQYCDNAVGAAGSTGRGEANIKVCGAFFVIEQMRQGVAPQQACLTALQRAVAMSERRLLDPKGRPMYGLQYYAVGKDGRYAGVTLYEGRQFAVADAKGARLEDCAFLYRRSEMPPSAW
ncbi:MAG TPA: N(4)-(beta-N-acetylglucosaminyl)-L-asparaginase [Gemmatimonadaceae bacterium]|nr:N(4)-(beta-N-acetylglucosaminyl)-L-asparaginase [Gemmatimonadaceae bacterium]